MGFSLVTHSLRSSLMLDLTETRAPPYGSSCQPPFQTLITSPVPSPQLWFNTPPPRKCVCVCVHTRECNSVHVKVLPPFRAVLASLHQLT